MTSLSALGLSVEVMLQVTNVIIRTFTLTLPLFVHVYLK